MKRLAKVGLSAVAIHGNKNQNQRTRALEAFKSGKVQTLVATDVAARGIDIPDITHVFNFELPNVPEQYVHRIGRTARAEAEGIAISFVATEKDTDEGFEPIIIEQHLADEETKKERFLKEHINSLKRHIEQLSAKKYEDIYQIESPDFVLLFIPIEPAFAVALNADNHLYNKAFEKNIVIVTPSTLLATLRTIDSMWNNEKQQRNAMEIARQAGALYDKFNGLLTDLIGIGKRIDDSKKEYSNAMNKLFEGRGNLITSVEKLKKMGAKSKKNLPENIVNRAKN